MEYKVISTRSDEDLSKQLSALAEEGWRFLSLSSTAVPPRGLVMKVAVIERDTIDDQIATLTEEINENINAHEEQEKRDSQIAFWFDKQVQQDHIDFIEQQNEQEYGNPADYIDQEL